MKNRNSVNTHQQNRKGASSRIATNQNQGLEKKVEPSTHSTKEKDQNIQMLVREYLEKNGYIRTVQTFKTQKPIKRAHSVHTNQKSVSDEEKSIMNAFDKGNREEFFKLGNKIFSNPEPSVRKLEFELNIYFCIYPIHPCIKKASCMDKTNAEAFRKYIDTKGCQVSEFTELLVFFALPHIQKPQEHSGMAHVFTKDWMKKIKAKVQQRIKENIKSSPSISTSKKFKTTLEELYQRSNSDKQMKQQSSNFQCKENCRHIQELIQSKAQYKEVVNYIDILQNNLKDLNDASKNNLIQSNKKWFHFSKDILQLAYRAAKGEKVKEKLDKYEKFFGHNIDELIYTSADISIFDKNSYFTEDISMVPQQKNVSQRKIEEKKQPQLCQVDLQKIMLLFSKGEKKQFQKQICLVLKALKNRFFKLKNAHQRRQVIVTYQRTDICAIKPQNYHIQKKLLLESSQKVKEFYLRLLNHITTDNLGNQYLSSSQKLIENLIGILGTTNEEVVYRKHVFGILQRFSYIKKSQMMMISFGIIPIIFRIFRNQAEELTYNSVQYLMGLIMNLAIKRESIKNFEKHRGEVIPLLLRYIDVEDSQIKGYVNGTLYVLLQMPSFRHEAQKYKLYQIVQDLLEKYSIKLNDLTDEELDIEMDDYGIVVRQYKYILQRLEQQPQNESQIGEYSDQEDDDQLEDELDEFDNASDVSYSSEYLQGEENMLSGEELLMKKFALLGPEAVREELLTRSILDETSRKSQNMTTSINHSKRIDKVFQKNQRPQTPSLLPHLDQSTPRIFS